MSDSSSSKGERWNRTKHAISAGVDDVRGKLVEEAWFGRKTSGNIAAESYGGGKTTNIDNSQNHTTNYLNDHSNHFDHSQSTVVNNTLHQHAAAYERATRPDSGPDIHGNAPVGQGRGADIHGNDPSANRQGSGQQQSQQRNDGLAPGY